MENLRKAVYKEMGVDIQRNQAKRCFIKLYKYLLYQDTASFSELLDYRSKLKHDHKSRERYYVFRFMLRILKNRHSRQYKVMCS